MNRNLIIWWALMLASIIWVVFTLTWDETKKLENNTAELKNLLKNRNLADEINNQATEKLKEVPKEEKKLTKEEELKKRYSLRSFIIKWDYYLDNNQPQKALQKYLIAYKKAPNDQKIIVRIAELYFDIWNYNNAYKFFLKAKDYDKTNKEKLVLSMIYSLDINDKSQITERAKILKDEINISTEEKIYYMTNMGCLVDFHICKKNFGKHIEEKWDNLTHPWYVNIKNAIKQYKDFQIGELYYKDILIAKAIMDNNLFPISAKISEEILEKKVNYGTALLIAWKSYYEYWNFEKAKSILKDYYELEPGNAKIAYMLGVIYSKLEDYEASSLYYNAAIKNDYPDKTDLERRLAYNYYLLSDTENMLKTFGYLIDEKDATENDFYLAIYSAIINKDTDKATLWSKKWLKRYPKEETFYGYLGWIYRELWNLEQSEKYLKLWNKLDIRNPLVTLNLWYLYETLEDYQKSKIYFEKTVAINSDWEFGSLAKKELVLVKQIISNEEKLKKVKQENN